MRVLLFETRTGDPVLDLQVSSWSYDTGINAPDVMSVSVPAYTPWAASLDLKSLLVRDKYALAFVDESVEGVRRVVAAGPIANVVPAEDVDGNNGYRVDARGPERILDFRQVRLYPGWPLVAGNGKPSGTYDQSFENVAYGTIMKRLVAESLLFDGGELPIAFEDDRAGVHARTQYAAVDGKSVLEALDQLADLSDGVEYDFQPEIDEFDKISWRLVTGTDSGRIISGGSVPVWNLGGVDPDVRGYERIPDSGPWFTDAVFMGGKGDDRVLAARSHDSDLVDAGFPRMELWDSSHSTVSVQSTLQSWADGSLTPVPDRFSFDVKAARAYGVRHGDGVKLAADGHWDLPNGTYDLRVLSVGVSSSDPDWVQINLV